MHIQSLFALSVACLAFAASNKHSYSVEITINTEAAGSDPSYNNYTVKMNNLAQVGGIKASEISLVRASAIGIHEGDIECRAYSDKAGVMVASHSFTKAKPAILSKNKLAKINSVLCYITGNPNGGSPKGYSSSSMSHETMKTTSTKMTSTEKPPKGYSTMTSKKTTHKPTTTAKPTTMSKKHKSTKNKTTKHKTTKTKTTKTKKAKQTQYAADEMQSSSM